MRPSSWVLWVAAGAWWASGCSDAAPGTGNGASQVFDAGDAAQAADGQAKDAVDAATSADTAAADQNTASDAADLDQTEAAAVADVDWSELLDPEDAGSAADLVEPVGPVGSLYAQTAEELYRLDPAAKKFVLVGKWSFDKNAGGVTDIAIDNYGQMIAITHDHLFKCGVDSAKCTWLAAMPQVFYGMTLVPKGTVDPNADALIGIAQSGDWVRITVAAGKVTLKTLGSFGGGWLCSGDAFSVNTVGTLATVKKASGGNDSLAEVDPKTGKVLKIIGDTGVKNLFGLAWWDQVVYGFSSDGGIYEIDTGNGKASPIKDIAAPKGLKWWGAGVSTRAAGK